MKYKISILICILLVFAFAGCIKTNLKSNNKADNKIVDESGITFLKIRNIKAQSKEIKDKSEITKILAVINSVKIVKSNVETPYGIGYGVDITYSNNKKETLSFLESTMLRNGTGYEIDKNIVDELRNIYDKN
jgi:5-bromo-4-chloroindolyl phosphate hydrolysis protein